MEEKREMLVTAIKDGTVIDHIPAEKLFEVVSILGLEGLDKEITIGNNLKSKKFGRKGIIKISDCFFAQEDLNRIAIVAPQAKVNIIRNFEVTEKRVLEIPDEIAGLVRCVNPKCITNNEPMTPRYRVVGRSPLQLKCRYCEREMSAAEIKLL